VPLGSTGILLPSNRTCCDDGWKPPSLELRQGSVCPQWAQPAATAGEGGLWSCLPAIRDIYLITVGRLKLDPRSQAYRHRKRAQGHSKGDVIWSLKRYVARELYYALKKDLQDLNRLADDRQPKTRPAD
jgi:hypothetical protein